MFYLDVPKFNALKFEALNIWKYNTFEWQTKGMQSYPRFSCTAFLPLCIASYWVSICHCHQCSKWCHWWLTVLFCMCVSVAKRQLHDQQFSPSSICEKAVLWFMAAVAIFTACYCLRLWVLHLVCYLTPWLQTNDLLFTSWSAVAVSWYFITRLPHVKMYLCVSL